MRLSSLTMSNDSQEGSVILDVLLQMARDSELDGYAISRLEGRLRSGIEFLDGLGFCLSEEGDLLSQWRGYADDGRGLSIGFRSDYFEKLSEAVRLRDEHGFTLKKLAYDIDGQRSVAEDGFGKLKALIELGAFRPEDGSLLFPSSEEQKQVIQVATRDAHFQILGLMLRMFDIKNPAFSEEREWRLVSFSHKSMQDAGMGHRACGDKIVPFLEFSFEDVGVPPIARVVLGPKHQTPLHVISRLLESKRFDGVEVVKSAATYR